MRSLSNALFDDSELDVCHVTLIDVLRTHFEDLPQLKAVSGKRKAFEDHLKTFARRADLLEKTVGRMTTGLKAGDHGVPGQSIFKVDLQVECNGLCGAIHAINVELCVQNREAIGTNYLKLEILGLLQQDKNSIGILICPDSRFFAASNMDSAYADDIEYIVAYKLSYHQVLKTKMLVLSLGD